MPQYLFGKRPSVPQRKRAQAGAFEAANIDTAGLDPAMKATLGQESARRVGAAGIALKFKNPFAGLFKKKK